MRSVALGILGAVFLQLPIASAHADDQNCDTTSRWLATQSVAPQTPSALKQFQNSEGTIPAVADVVLLGDSLAFFFPAPVVASTFANAPVYNFALGANRTQNVIWQLDQTKTGSLHPKFVVAFVGTNSLSDGVAGCGVAAGVSEILTRTEKKWPEAHILLFKVLPFGQDFTAADDQRKQLNGLLQDIAAKDPRVTFVDVDENEMTCGMRGQSSLVTTVRLVFPDFRQCRFYQNDNVHFSEEGYRVLSARLAAAIADLAGKNPGKVAAPASASK